jgi:hypothetical protein
VKAICHGAKRIQLAIGEAERKALTCEQQNAEEEANAREETWRQDIEALKKTSHEREPHYAERTGKRVNTRDIIEDIGNQFEEIAQEFEAMEAALFPDGRKQASQQSRNRAIIENGSEIAE